VYLEPLNMQASGGADPVGSIKSISPKDAPQPAGSSDPGQDSKVTDINKEKTS
jgi:hypothetical protein